MKHIFLIDLDGTIIGDITPQIIMWELSKTQSRKGGIKFDTKGLQEKLKTGHIVRPGFIEFFKYVKSLDHLIYVYTASEKTWANFIISQIEKAFDIKFERPVFTRHDCKLLNNQFIKSLKFISKPLERSLKKKGISHLDLSKHVTIIDNTHVYNPSDQSNLVICPSYSYRHPENIASQISYDQFSQHIVPINDLMIKYIPEYNAPTTDFWSFQKRTSIYYVNSITLMKQSMQTTKQDKFFFYLMRLVREHPRNVFAKYINRNLKL